MVPPHPSAAPARLPARPLLAPHTPVLVRSPALLQVGLEPSAVLLHHRAAASLVGRLDGETDLATLHEVGREAGMAPAAVGEVLQALLTAGLLVSSPPTPRTGTPVRLVGLGPLGQQVARLLLTAGLRVYAAPGRPEEAALPLAALLTRGARGSRLSLVNHWSKPERPDVALTVVAADTVEPDRLVTDALLRADQPHLVLRAAGSVGTVGPLVQPGRTACLRCTDLTRRDADPDWPGLLRQLVRLRVPAPEVVLSWVAGVGAAQALAHLQGQLPEAAGGTVELTASDHLMRWRAWPVHAACGCAWAATTEWGP